MLSYIQVFTDGTTNKLIGCCMPKTSQSDDISLDCDDLSLYDVILIRIYGKNTEVLIDRKKEIANFKLLHSYGFAPQLLAVFNNGLAYEYSDGEPLTKTTIYEEHVWQQVAKRMAEMHRDIERENVQTVNQDDKSSPKAILWGKINEFFDLVPSKYADSIKQQR